MSEYHDFYEIESIGPKVLWDIWCSYDPVSLTELLKYDFSNRHIRRHVMYYVSSELLIPVQLEEDIGFVFNPTIEWMIAVSSLVRTNSPTELKDQLREADAERRIYTDLYEYTTSEDYYSEDPNPDVTEFLQWITAEYKADWIADALEYYDHFSTLFEETDSLQQYPTISKEAVEKELVEQTEF